MLLLHVTWGPNQPADPKPVKIKRRWWPWPFSDNVVLGPTTVWAKHSQLNSPTIRHELTHIVQYRSNGRWWVWTHPTQREAEARAAERAIWPQWVQL